jgi:1,4-dihydroxy-2-naphthoate octaprenyltransferase
MALGARGAASTPNAGLARMRPGRALVAMARPSQLALVWAVYAAGVLLGLARTGTAVEPWPVLMGALLIGASAVSAHLVNEAEDADTDRRTVRTPFSGGSGALAASGLHPSVPLRAGLALAVAVVAATWLAWVGLGLPAPAATLVLAGLAGALCYSLPPLAAMRHGWGEPLNALLGGLLLPLAGVAVVVGSVGLADLLAFAPFALVVLASVMATAWPDREADASTGKLTLQVRLEPRTLRRVHGAASVAAVASMWLVAMADASPFALTGLLIVPALAVGVLHYTRRTSPLPNVAAMVGFTLVLLAANGAGLVSGWGT